PAIPISGQGVAGTPGRTTAADMYNAMRAQRSELRRQLESLEEKRADLIRQTQQTDAGSPDRAGLEARLKEVDARIASVDQEIAASDAAVARAASVPGAVVETPPRGREGPPEEVFVLSGMFLVFVLFPISVAIARRLWRRGGPAQSVGPLAPELSDRFTRLEQAVDAIAVEVERVGEGQRYMSRQFTEGAAHRAIGAGAAEPIELKQREQIPSEQRR
ncbi:MAG: hypothetical protein ABI877_22255, partial [Gemmatimonadaceae bacterium]